MTSPSKEAADPNVITNSAMRKRTTPTSSSPTKRLQKRRMSIKKDRRRVSFAPDPELTMVHHFEKDDDQSSGHPSPMIFEKIDEGRDGLLPSHPQTAPQEGAAPLSSPQHADMDITAGLTGNQDWNVPPINTVPGEITAQLPSLAAIAEADELYQSNNDNTHPINLEHLEPGNITASIPGFAALIEEDERANGDMATTDPSGAVASPPIGLMPPSSAARTTRTPSMHRAPSTSPASQGGLPTEQRPDGLANKWGFVPGDDDTLNMDLRQHGRMFMSDTTYSKMYADNTMMTTAGPALRDSPVDSTSISTGALAQDEEEQHQQQDANADRQGAFADDVNNDNDNNNNTDGGIPNWTAPAFLPPYMLNTAHPSADHPALHQSPDVTNSSINTMSTRRFSVDARRQSVTSRGVVGPSHGLYTVTSPPLHHNNNVVSQQQQPIIQAPDSIDRGAGGSDVTDDLLADDDDDDVIVNGGVDTVPRGDVLAGLKQQMRMLNQGSPAVNGMTTGPLSMGFAGSSHKGTTGGLLHTGGITDFLMNDGDNNAHGGGDNNNDDDGAAAHNNNNTTSHLLHMDITASSAAKGAMPPQQQQQQHYHQQRQYQYQHHPSPIQENAPMSPPHSGVHKMSHSPPMSALTGGSYGRRMSPAVIGQQHSVHSVRSQSILGTTPGTQRLAPHHHHHHHTPKSGMALVPLHPNGPASGAPGSTAAGWHPAPPGSAIAARYPGSAVATGRLSQGFTPSNLPPITFQDFAKVVEVQFLDNLRRGASINYADLQPNPVPTNLSEAYSLLCITSPSVAELETAIHTLQSETARLRSSAADLELMLGQANPPIFRHVQTASYEQLEALRSNIALLKKMCRAKALVLLKDVRCQMEESRSKRLARALNGLRGDLTFVTEHRQHTQGVAEAAELFAQHTRERLARESEERAAEIDRRRRTLAARAALAEQRSANADRQRRLEEAITRAEDLQRERDALASSRLTAHEEVEGLRATIRALQIARGRGKEGSALGGLSSSSLFSSDPRSVLERLDVVAALERCLGMAVEQTSADASGGKSIVLKVGSMFRLRITASPAGIRGTVELIDPLKQKRSQYATDSTASSSSSSSSLTLSSSAPRFLAAAVAGCGTTAVEGSSSDAFFVDPNGVAAAVQATVARLQRSSELAVELDGIRAACSHLCEVSAAARQGHGGVRFLFVGMHAEVRFAVTLFPGSAYPLGALPHESKIWFDGDGQITSTEISRAVAKATVGPGRIRAVCAELSALVERAAPHVPSSIDMLTYLKSIRV